MIVYDVIVNGQKIETLRPMTSRLKELLHYIEGQISMLEEKYGSEVRLTRRFEY